MASFTLASDLLAYLINRLMVGRLGFEEGSLV